MSLRCRYLASISLFLLCVTTTPRSAPAGDDWQAIAPEDLALKDNPASPGAHAMILYRESMVDANQGSVREYMRIKIFTEEGRKEANVEIPFVKGFDDIQDVRARTIRPDGTVVNYEGKPFEKTVVKVSGYKVLAKTFTLPEVQPGCIIEYSVPGSIRFELRLQRAVEGVREFIYEAGAFFNQTQHAKRIAGADVPALWIAARSDTATSERWIVHARAA